VSSYIPWAFAGVFAAVVVFVRLATNRVMERDRRAPSAWISAIYIGGFLGLSFTFFWSMFAIAWWACLPVLVVYGLTCLVPSSVQRGTSDPTTVHLAAIQQASDELSGMPPGSDKMQAITKRADEIMRAQGWQPRQEV